MKLTLSKAEIPPHLLKYFKPIGYKPKDLVNIPNLVAEALREDGWYLRADIIFSKKNPMPESVTDRPTKAHEYLFLLTKSPKYFYDAEAIKEQAKPESAKRYEYEFMNGPKHVSGGYSTNGQTHTAGMKEFNNNRNRRSVWEIATQPYPEAHFATFPEALIEPCILAGTSAKGVCNVCQSPFERIVEKELKATRGKVGHHNGEGPRKDETKMDAGTAWNHSGGVYGRYETQTISWQPTCKCIQKRTPNFGMKGSELLELVDEVAREFQPVPAIVLDPFMGSGTTGSVAKRLGRYYLGFELNPDYIKLATKRINNTQPPLFVLT